MTLRALPVLTAIGVAASLCVGARAQDAGPRPIEPLEDLPSEQMLSVDAGTEPATPKIVIGASVEPSPVPFGQAFFLVVTIARDRGLRLEIPAGIPEVDAAPRTGEPTRTVVDTDKGRVKETLRIPFLALDTVDVKTPAFSLVDKSGASFEVASLNVSVVTAPEPPPGPNPGPNAANVPDAGPDAPPPGAVVLESAMPAIAYAVPDQRPWITLGGLSAFAIIFFVMRRFMKRKRAEAALRGPPPPPPRPAHEIALERLDALLASGLLQNGETASFVGRLMDEVLRDYLTGRFALSAGTRTTRELVKDLLGIAVAGLDVVLVEKLLADADLVKFAKANIAADVAHAMATRVRTLVETTADTTTDKRDPTPRPT